MLHHIAALVDEGRYAGIGRAANPPAVFNGTQLGVIQVLIFTRGILPPAIVGDNRDKLGAFFYRAGYIAAPNRFETNNRIDANTALRIKNSGFALCSIASNSTSQVLKNRF